MKNVTITLDEKTAAWARVAAAKQNQSLSRFVGGLLQKQMKDNDAYEKAMQHYLSKKPVPLGEPGEPFLTREEVNDRARFRR